MQAERRDREAQHAGKDSLPPAQALDPERDSERDPDQHTEQRDAVGVHAANHIEVGFLRSGHRWQATARLGWPASDARLRGMAPGGQGAASLAASCAARATRCGPSRCCSARAMR
jgi:hypothetical protein